MCLQRFATSFIIVILFVPSEEFSLWSDLGKSKHFVASEAVWLAPEDLDDNMYSQLMQEAPHVKEFWRSMREGDLPPQPGSLEYEAEETSERAKRTRARSGRRRGLGSGGGRRGGRGFSRLQ